MFGGRFLAQWIPTQEYFGQYVSDDSGRLTFQEGILVEAVKKGCGIFLIVWGQSISRVLFLVSSILVQSHVHGINPHMSRYWLVLDELNLAPSEILEALNRLLDDNRELYIPDTQEVWKRDWKFLSWMKSCLFFPFFELNSSILDFSEPLSYLCCLFLNSLRI